MLQTVLQICKPDCLEFASIQDLTQEEMHDRHCPCCDMPAVYLTFEVVSMMLMSILADQGPQYLQMHEVVAHQAVDERHRRLNMHAN